MRGAQRLQLLDAFERWMLGRQIERAHDVGFDVVAAELRAQGYGRLAAAVTLAGRDA